jgi:DNA-binding response OmpR family regulator
MMTQPVLLPKPPKPVLPRACRVVVALTDADHARAVQATFRRQGWEVHVPTPGADPRETMRKARARAVVLDTAPEGEESGYLTCKKLLLERPATKVVLVGQHVLENDRRLAEFVGAAALVPAANSLGVVSAVMGLRLPSLS